MWNISYTKKGMCVLVGRKERLTDAVRIAQVEANKINRIVNVHEGCKLYKVISPQRKEVKCTTL